jgi:GTP-binding protein LepA
LPGYQPIKPVVFIGLYPTEGSEINLLRDALSKLKLSDSALTYTPEHSPALGNGFRVGLLGLLHADIVQERLEREFDLSLIASAPSVSYEITKTNGVKEFISKVGDLPDPSQIVQIGEPVIKLSIFVPEKYVGGVMQLCQNYRATMADMIYLNKLVHLTYTMPFAELIRSFYDQLKSVSSGYATLDYELIGYHPANLVRLDILVGGENVDALSQIVPREKAEATGRSFVEKMKDIIPRQNFDIAIQAAIGGKIIARADIKPFRKDVTAKLYGGDQTRKDKLLKKQKKGKARMKRVGQVDIPQAAFLAILSLS